VSTVIDPLSSDSAATAAAVAPLRRMLDVLRRQTRRWIWVESLALACLAVTAFFWGSLFLDWAVEPPKAVRAAILACAAIGLAALLQRKLWSRLATGLGDASLAVVVERTHPAFRDSLSTAIELADEPAADVDAELLARTTTEATAHLGLVRTDRIFRRRELIMLALAAALAAASIVTLAFARPAIAGLWVRRLPLLGDDSWPRRVQMEIEDFPGGVRKVARGSDVDVVVNVRAEDGSLPDLVDLRWRGAPDGARSRGAAGGFGGSWRTDRMGTRGGVTEGGQVFGHVLKSVGESLELEVRGGDARLRNLRLEVLEPPALEKLVVTATLPDYLGGGTRVLPPARIVQIPRGASVEIACTSTKPLSAARMTATDAGPAASGAAARAEELLAAVPPTGAAGDRVITGRIAALDADRAIVVGFTDADGLVNREPVTFVISAVADEAPEVSLRLFGVSIAVTPRARVPLVGTIADDHGLGAAAVVIKGAAGAETTLPIPRVRAGDAQVELPPETPETVQLEPLGLAPGQKLEVAVTARDTCTLAGGPNVGASVPWSLDVVAPEALVAMLEAREIILRRRYESCIADLTQARDRLAAGDDAQPGDEGRSAAAGLGEAASRAAGETAELAEAFRGIRHEFDNNQLLSPELETRLITQIAGPLAALSVQDIPALAAACRGAPAREGLLRRSDEVLARMRAVLDKMMELESFNEVLELLRGMIRTQEQIRAETLEQQKRRAREALERP
jgi:hypothetical protein